MSVPDVKWAAERLRPDSMVVVAVGDASKITRELSDLNLGPLYIVNSFKGDERQEQS